MKTLTFLVGLFIIATTVLNAFQEHNKIESTSVCLNPMVYAVQANVTDLDRGVDFYQALGFELITRSHFPRVAPMKNKSTMLVLHKVEKIFQTNPNAARTTLNLSVNNLDKLISDLKGKGVEIIHNESQKAAVGIYAAFQDPFGIVHELLEVQFKN